MSHQEVKSIPDLIVEIASREYYFTNSGKDVVAYPEIKTSVSFDGYTAHAMKKLIVGGIDGIYITEIRIDAVARLRQEGIVLEAFADENRGTGRRRNWLRLPFAKGTTYTIVDTSEMAVA